MIIALKKWKIACPHSKLELIFPNQAGNPLCHSNMSRRHFFLALKKVGIKRVRFHDLRHIYASLLIEQGENIKYPDTTGHSSPTMTLYVYVHLMKPVNREATIMLEKMIFEEMVAKW